MYKEKKINVNLSFNNGPVVDILDNHSPKYLVEFYENLGNDWALVHSMHNILPFHFYGYNRKFRTDWRIKVWGWENLKPVLLVDYIYNEVDKNILLVFEHNNYNTQRVWLNSAITFRDKNRCELLIKSKFKDRLKDDFKNQKITFYDLNENIDKEIYATYKIKKFDIQSQTANFWESDLIFENHSKAYKNWNIPVDWVTIPNEKIIDYILNYE